MSHLRDSVDTVNAEVPQTVTEERLGPKDWKSAVESAEGPRIVVGGPGTGKSEFLVRRTLHLLNSLEIPPTEILVLSFGRRGVADLRDRIRSKVPRTIGALDITTFHSYASRLLEAHGAKIGMPHVPTILTGPEQSAVVRELLSSENAHDWAPAIRPLLATSTFAGEVTDYLLRIHEQLIDDDSFAEIASRRDDWRGLPAFAIRYRKELQTRDRIDYGLLIAEAERLLRQFNGLELGIRFILVDEYQDMTTSQVAMLKALAKPHKNITAAADPYQSIYSFRGAALSNVADFPHIFGSVKKSAIRTVLTTSFRTPKEVLDAAVRLTKGGDLPGAAGTVTPAANTGRVEVRVFEQQTAETEWVANEIARIHLTEGLPLRSIGVFVRSKQRFLPELSRALERRRIPHDKPDASFVSQPSVRFVLDLVHATLEDQGPAETEQAVRRILLGPVMMLPLGQVRDIERMQVRDQTTWANAICMIVKEGAALATLLASAAWANAMPAADGFWNIWTGLPQLRTIATDPKRQNERAAWTSLGQVLTRWNERNPHSTLADYTHLLENEEFEARPLLSYRTPSDNQVVMTALHQSKGIELDIVFICDAVEGVFPDLRPRDSLLGTRYLLPHIPDDLISYRRFRLQEERRLAYTAMGRARQRVIWTATSSEIGDGQGMPSRFLSLAAGDTTIYYGTTHAVDPAPLSQREAETYLVRLASDPRAVKPHRAAAIAILAQGPRWGLRHPEQLRGIRKRGSDSGLVSKNHPLSPTQAERYDLCPRLYALENRLKLGARTSLHARFGNLIHDVLEDVESAARARGNTRSTITEARTAFNAAFIDESFGSGVFAEAWRRRGHQVLEHLYTHWPKWGEVVALESTLRLDLAGITWTGRADRIEAKNGELKIIDYKTGRSAVEVKKAAESIQLGYYLLAAAASPAVATFGKPTAAELWYPGTSTKSLTTRSFDNTNLDKMPQRLTDLAGGIQAEHWPATPNESCERCPVRIVCPAWPEGGPDYT